MVRALLPFVTLQRGGTQGSIANRPIKLPALSQQSLLIIIQPSHGRGFGQRDPDGQGQLLPRAPRCARATTRRLPSTTLHDEFIEFHKELLSADLNDKLPRAGWFGSMKPVLTMPPGLGSPMQLGRLPF